jgi:hypothetical protein
MFRAEAGNYFCLRATLRLFSCLAGQISVKKQIYTGKNLLFEGRTWPVGRMLPLHGLGPQNSKKLEALL